MEKINFYGAKTHKSMSNLFCSVMLVHWKMILEDGSSHGKFTVSGNYLYWHRTTEKTQSYTESKLVNSWLAPILKFPGNPAQFFATAVFSPSSSMAITSMSLCESAYRKL